MQLLNHALIVFSWATTAFAAIYEKFSDLPANKYDFVVVGGVYPVCPALNHNLKSCGIIMIQEEHQGM